MRVNRPIIKILRKIKMDHSDDSILDITIRHLYNTEDMHVSEIAAVLEIGVGSVYKALRKNIS